MRRRCRDSGSGGVLRHRAEKVYYTLGGIRRTGADGKTGTARGAITPDGIYLRCDDDSASVTQLAGHELYHYYEEQFPGLHDRVRQKITERYSEEEFREIAGRYAEKLGRLNGMADDAFQAAREIIKGGRVYVPESVKHEFGDDWGFFRREAFAEGVLLTNNREERTVRQKARMTVLQSSGLLQL